MDKKPRDYSHWPQATVMGRRDLTRDLMIIKLRMPMLFPFEPGQYCTLWLPGFDPDPYSIVSAPHELPTVELFVELVPKERALPESITPRLWKLHKGDTVFVGPKAKGIFVLDASYSRHVFVATVTGAAPFVSCLRAYAAGYYRERIPQSSFYIFQGASFRDEFGYDKELERLARSGSIVYEKTASRFGERDPSCRNRGWRGNRGRVNDIFFNLAHKHGITNDGKTLVYVCGNEGMIDSLANKKATDDKPMGKLVEAGFPVRTEAFF